MADIFVGPVAMADIFVGPVMEKIINACSEYLKDQFRWQIGMKKELERLRENHPKIQAVVFASNQAEIKDQYLSKWLWQLRDAIDEADDLLDEFEYMKLKEELPENTEKTKKRKMSCFLFEGARKILKVGERVFKTDPNLKRLVEVVQKLDKVSADVGNFLYLLESTKQEQQKQELELYKRRETGSLPKNVLIGREKEKAYIMQWLNKPSDEEDQTLITGNDLYRNISLLSIVGHGGMGKTTLLQHVYEDQMTEQFELKMWVCVSSNFDMKRAIVNMLESLSKKKYDLDSLDALQGMLKSKVRSKKFLLVLDDIWEDEDQDNSKWGNVLAPLAYGGPGSKILVTTRMNSAALMIAKAIEIKKETLSLNGLEDNECLHLLTIHAFADVKNPSDHKKLRSIAKDLIKKLSGSPLAAKVIGGVLNSSFDESDWKKVLKSDFGSAEFGQDGIMRVLRLSYKSLSKPLQNCFAFCSTFPEDYVFDKDDLVRMWIAVGFIQLTCIQGETMEDIGRRYFDVLVKSSFFDKYLRYGTKYYKMHDLLHELARSVSIQEFLRVTDSKELPFEIPETIRYLTVETGNLEVLRKIENFKNLRTLHISYHGDGGGQDVSDVLAKIFKASRSIRLLHLNSRALEMIPEEIGYFMHLRYLRLNLSSITMLPRSLSNLYHLQFLMVSNMSSLSNCEDFLPRDINNLSSLRYLEMPVGVIPVIHGIGKLKYLQELNEFSHRNEIGYKIGELEHMNDLCKLTIKFLDNVEDAEEACNAKLYDKRNLADLLLEWSDNEIQSSNLIDLNEKVLDNLQPHNCLKNLTIYQYMGARSPIWMNNANLISNLERIELAGCLEWETLPPFGQLPFLKYLDLSNMPKVTRIDNKCHENGKFYVFPSLEVLRIVELEELEDWFDASVATTTTDDCFFPCLVELELVSCPKLKELPFLPPKLMSLVIAFIEWNTLNCCSISKSFPLEKLVVHGCPNITSLHMVDEIARLSTLRFLTITDCPNLISLGGHQQLETTDNGQLILSNLNISDPSMLLMEPFRSITSLKKLSIEYNNELVSFPNEAEQWFSKVSSSLFELSLLNLISLESLPSSLESLSSLKSLNLLDVPQLQLLPDLPPSLKSLRIWKCHPELEERYRVESSDWHKIARIPRVNISL